MSKVRPSIIENRVREGAYILLDGGLATELERRGHDLNHPLWSARVLLENPEAIRAVHEDFLTAGADIITTASYQATIPGFEREGLTRAEAEAALLRAVALADQARERIRPDALIAASIGPFGAFLADGSEYAGKYGNSRNALLQFHRERLEILTNSPTDLLAFETIPSLTETEVLTELLSSIPGPPAWIAFQCGDAAHLADGAPLIDAVRLADAVPNIFAIGVNCVPPRIVPALITCIRSASTKPIAVYPNSGEVFDPVTKAWSGTADPASFAAAASQWRRAGASLIGGCCRTTPAHIRALRETLSRGRQSGPAL